RLISKHFDVVEIEVLGKWLGIVADRRAGSNRGAETFQPTTALMEKLENAFYQTERVLRDELSLTKKNLDEANQKYRGATEQITAQKNRTTTVDARRQEAKQTHRGATKQVTATQRRTTQEQTALEQERKRVTQGTHAASATT